MKKRAIEMLERAFAAEVVSAFNGMPPLIQPRAGKLVAELVEDGYLVAREERLSGYPPVTVKGYCLTELGHFTYCTSTETPHDKD